MTDSYGVHRRRGTTGMRLGTRPGAPASRFCWTDAFCLLALAVLILGMGFTPKHNDRVLGTLVRGLEVNRFEEEKSCAIKII